jgi:hypothetical protein
VLNDGRRAEECDHRPPSSSSSPPCKSQGPKCDGFKVIEQKELGPDSGLFHCSASVAVRAQLAESIRRRGKQAILFLLNRKECRKQMDDECETGFTKFLGAFTSIQKSRNVISALMHTDDFYYDHYYSNQFN